jgi:taurine transport system permease protein
MIVSFYLVIFSFAFLRRLPRPGAIAAHHAHDFTSLKTVTFGDESAVSPNRRPRHLGDRDLLRSGEHSPARLVPIHVPGAVCRRYTFTYTAENRRARRTARWCRARPPCRRGGPAPRGVDRATVSPSTTASRWRLAQRACAASSENDIGGGGWLPRGRSMASPSRRTTVVRLPTATVTMTARAAAQLRARQGLADGTDLAAPPEAVASRLGEIASRGLSRTSRCWEHLGYSLSG